jgi:hypothetical protein
MISVFKTNINDKKTVSYIIQALKNDTRIISVNFDLVDVDKILRIVSECSLSYEIIGIINSFGFECEELE